MLWVKTCHDVKPVWGVKLQILRWVPLRPPLTAAGTQPLFTHSYPSTPLTNSESNEEFSVLLKDTMAFVSRSWDENLNLQIVREEDTPNPHENVRYYIAVTVA